MVEEDLESKSSWDPVTASLTACLCTGAYVGYVHAGGNVNLDTDLILPAITAGISTLAFRNEANPSRGDIDAQRCGKTRMAFVGAGTGIVINFVGYGIGHGIEYAVDVVNRYFFL